MKKVFSVNGLRAVHALVFTLCLSACAPQAAGDENLRGGHNVQSATKEGTSEVRHELEPLTKRFPQLSDAASATWMSGTMGDPRVPGPSTYWIDAIVELPVAEHSELLNAVSATELPLPDDFSPQLHAAIPHGRLLNSSELNERFSHGKFVCKVYLVTDGQTLILSTLFQ